MTLARCPFHKPESNLSEVVGEWYSNQRIAFWAVMCEACSARGPEEKTKEEAIESWNYLNRVRNELNELKEDHRYLQGLIHSLSAEVDAPEDAGPRQVLMKACEVVRSLTEKQELIRNEAATAALEQAAQVAHERGEHYKALQHQSAQDDGRDVVLYRSMKEAAQWIEIAIGNLKPDAAIGNDKK